MPSGWMVELRMNPKKNADGVSSYLSWTGFWSRSPFIFKTKKDCKAYIDHKYGYIKQRKDLRKYPYGWLMPQPVRVKITATKATTNE